MKQKLPVFSGFSVWIDIICACSALHPALNQALAIAVAHNGMQIAFLLRR
jgi:hypothetical protein